MRPGLQTLLVLALLAPTAALHAQNQTANDAAHQAAMEAYIRFLPRYYAVTTMDRFTDVDKPTRTPQSPVNQLGYRDERTDDTVDWIVRANADTVLAAGFLDLSQGPVLVQVPKATKRYWRVQLTDLWTRGVETGLSSLHDAEPGVYAIAGPDHPGDVAGAKRTIRAAENLNYLAIHVSPRGIEREGPSNADVDNAIKILRQFTLAPAGQKPAKKAKRSDKARALPRSLHVTTAELAKNRPLKLLDAIRHAVKRPGTPMTDEDQAALATLEPHLDAALADENPRAAAAMIEGLQTARRRIDNRVRAAGDESNGWAVLKPGIGDDLLDRAAAAEYALFADRGDHVMWLETHVDESGEPLRGDRRYFILFEEDATPPAEAFWSLTTYQDDDLALAPVSINRNSIGSLAERLKIRKGGKTLLFIQHVRPGQNKIIGWLPAPQGTFSVVARAYGPKDALLNGQYTMPVIVRSDIHVWDPLKLLDD